MPAPFRTFLARANCNSFNPPRVRQIEAFMISNKLGSSRMDQPSLAFLPGNDSNFANPKASTACLLAILIIINGGWQIFETYPAGFQAELPPPSTEPHQILVKITNADQITVDGHATNFVRVYSDLAIAIRDHQRLGQSTRIALSADKDSSWNAAISVRDAAREAGDDDFAFGWRQ